ncbi:hypothetical protein HRED_08513, partial [Candidatus Haloredivivus sp. G17]
MKAEDNTYQIFSFSLILKEIEDAIRNGNGITGRFMNSATGLYNTVTNADNVQRGLAAVIL